MAPARSVAIAGGGAAGIFAAIACAQARGGAEVTVFEAAPNLLAKVRISGGGRCNVTNACAEARLLAANYPRGGRELLGPLNRFGARDTVDWFAARGVALKTEPDGRMFPTTDDSSTIVDCLVGEAKAAGVRLRTKCGVLSVRRRDETGFAVGLSTGETLVADRVLIATGGTRGSAGLAIARHLGHGVEPPVPSLFAFDIEDSRLRGLAGLSVERAQAKVPDTRLSAEGPLLVTHRGLSGPAILRLSAWGARELHAAHYSFKLSVNWAAPLTQPQASKLLAAERESHPRRRASTANPFAIPARLWERLSEAAGLQPAAVWAGVSNAALESLSLQTTRCAFDVNGKSMNKEEFVTCGGVRLREVDFSSMESLLCPGLFFAGEVLDIDGVTGGFNFQAAWTTGWHAGRAMAS